MDDTEKQTCEHQSHCHFRIDPRATVVDTINLGHLFTQPTEIQHPIDTNQNMIVGY